MEERNTPPSTAAEAHMAYTPGWMSQEGRALISSSPHTPPKEPPTCQMLCQDRAAP